MEVLAALKERSADHSKAIESLIGWGAEKNTTESSNSIESTPIDPSPVQDIPIQKSCVPKSYREWDKLDIDEMCNSIDEPKKSQVKSSSKKSTSSSTPKESSVDTFLRKQTAIKKSLVEKELGNSFFSSSKYDEAIKHYSLAIELHNNHVFYLNRAICWLKLEKFKECIEDCSYVLSIEPKNSKALWRRANAQKELREYKLAITDLELLVVLEPSSSIFKKELDYLNLLIKKKRRVPIQVIECETEMNNDVKVINASECEKIERASIHNDFAQRENLKNVEIVESETKKLTISDCSKDNEKSMILEEIANQPTKCEKKMSIEKISPKKIESKGRSYQIPKGVNEFERDWKSLQSNSLELYEYMKKIDPKSFKTLFKNCLQSTHFSKFFEILATIYVEKDSVETVIEFLEELCKTSRFEMNIMFMNKSDRKYLESIFEVVGCKDLKKKYLK